MESSIVNEACWDQGNCSVSAVCSTIGGFPIGGFTVFDNLEIYCGVVLPHTTCTVKPPIGNTPMAEHTADTEQFPWSQHASLTYQRIQLRNNFLLGIKIWSRTRSLLEVFTVLVIDESQNVEKNH